VDATNEAECKITSPIDVTAQISLGRGRGA